MAVKTLNSVRYSLEMIREEVRYLIERGIIDRHQPIYTLWKYIPAREWDHLEIELERNDFLLRDRIGDLLSHEDWDND
jgi:uncharacterized protein YqgQ